MRQIKCCYKCVAPKRNVGCHADCPDYIREKAQSDEDRDLRTRAKETDAAAKSVQWHGKLVHDRRIGKKVI